MMVERFTDRANKILDLALREALQLGHNYVAPEHLLLAMVREGESLAAQALDEGTRKRVIDLMRGTAEQPLSLADRIIASYRTKLFKMAGRSGPVGFDAIERAVNEAVHEETTRDNPEQGTR